MSAANTTPLGPAGSASADPQVAELKREIAALRGELRLLRVAHAELERVAVLDTLTPLYNRRYFISALNERIVRRTRYHTRCAVLFIDINRMKHINDFHGHAAGDYALMHAAQILAAHVRSTDVAARIGGDEFALILEELDEEQARAKAEALEAALLATPCAFGEVLLPVTASIGMAIIEANDREEAVTERADADMYARKRAQQAASGGQRSER
jgi:diguanylate cyclase (GGDEF)-like protein